MNKHLRILISARYKLIGLLLVLGLSSSSGQVLGGFGEASNTAGVWKMSFEPGIHLISFPLLPANADLGNVLSDQLPGGTEWSESTRILTRGNSTMRGSYYNSLDDEWVGTLHNLENELGYWLVIPDDGGTVQITLIGAAIDIGEVEMGIIDPGMNIVASPYLFPSSLAASGLDESGFEGADYVVTSDRIYTWIDDQLTPAWYSPINGWQGADYSLRPGNGYVIVVAPGHSSFSWVADSPSEMAGQNPETEDETFIPASILNMAVDISEFNFPPYAESEIVREPIKPENSSSGRLKRATNSDEGGDR